jgi:PIN domain nuclease of toxin-antitoxin system
MEIAIKLKIGKLSDYELSCEQISKQWEINNFEWLKIKNKHLFAYNQVPFFEDHRDPFDRFLIATCQSESMYLLSSDGKFHRYKDLIQLL